jgi:hypothetical protein
MKEPNFHWQLAVLSLGFAAALAFLLRACVLVDYKGGW